MRKLTLVAMFLALALHAQSNPARGLIALISTPSGLTVGSGVTAYAFPLGGVTSTSTETARQMAVPRSGTIANLMVITNGTQSSSGSLVLTYRTGPFGSAGTSQALTVTIPASGVAGIYQDTTHSFKYIAGNALDIQLVNSATATSTGINMIYAELRGVY